MEVTMNADGITFSTQRTWIRIEDEEQLLCLKENYIMCSVIGNTGIFHLLKRVSGIGHELYRYTLLKYTVDDETGKIIMYTMGISTDEAKEILDHSFQIKWF